MDYASALAVCARLLLEGLVEEGRRHDTTQHNATQRNTTQRNTTQHNTTQHNATQHNTTQHNTTQHLLPLDGLQPVLQCYAYVIYGLGEALEALERSVKMKEAVLGVDHPCAKYARVQLRELQVFFLLTLLSDSLSFRTTYSTRRFYFCKETDHDTTFASVVCLHVMSHA